MSNSTFWAWTLGISDLHVAAGIATVLAACVLWCIWQGPRDE